MIYCFDIDGTLSEKSHVWLPLMKALMESGHMVYPLTGTVIGVNQSGEEYRINQLAFYGMKKGEHYTDVVVCVGNSPEDCGEMKGKFCKERGVAFMVEDTGIYAASIQRHSPETLCLRMPNGLH